MCVCAAAASIVVVGRCNLACLYIHPVECNLDGNRTNVEIATTTILDNTPATL